MTKPNSNSMCASRNILASVLVALFASGCVGAAVNSTTYAVKAAPRAELEPLAEAGEAEAQYELGKSYCCMGPGFDTQTATEWLCRAARQKNREAMLELGRIYLGDVSRTAAPGQKLLRAVSAKEAKPVAYVWLTRASDNGHEKAQEWLGRLTTRMTEEDLRRAEEFDKKWPDVPCEYNQVFGEQRQQNQ